MLGYEMAQCSSVPASDLKVLHMMCTLETSKERAWGLALCLPGTTCSTDTVQTSRPPGPPAGSTAHGVPRRILRRIDRSEVNIDADGCRLVSFPADVWPTVSQGEAAPCL